MLKYSTSPSRTSLSDLSPDEDKKLRLAFGRFAQEQYRKDGEAVVSYHYEKKRWLHCDCRPDATRVPTLFLVDGSHIRRELKDQGTPHHEGCIFAREPQEQINLVSSYRRANPDNEHHLNLLRNFRDNHPELPCSTMQVTTNRSRPSLARVLCTLLHMAKLDRFFSTTPLYGNREQQIADLVKATEAFFLAPRQPLSNWFATSLRGYYDLKKRLEDKPAGWKRPHGLFIETFDRVEDNILYPRRSDKKPIEVTGKLAVFGEGEKTFRPPYLVIGLLSQPRRNARYVELLNAYAHPCVSWNRLTLIDSELERETLKLLIFCRDWLVKNHNIEVTIRKPLFDVGPAETEEPRELCLPDFILRCRGQDVLHQRVVIETMGYNDVDYRERKQRMHGLFERIGQNSYPVPVIEHDRFKPGLTDKEVDLNFRQAVCNAITGQERIRQAS